MTSPSPEGHVDVDPDAEVPAEAEGTALTTDDGAQRDDTPADPDTEAS